MTPEEAKELLPIITAFAEGKTVQMKIDAEWISRSEFLFNSNPNNYRIKPETVILKYRLALMNASGYHYIAVKNMERSNNKLPDSPYFVKYISDELTIAIAIDE